MIPYGYRVTKTHRIVKDAKQQQVLRSINMWRQQNYTLEQIAARLAAQGVMPPGRSKTWNRENIDWILTRGDVTPPSRVRMPAAIVYMDMRGNVVADPTKANDGHKPQANK